VTGVIRSWRSQPARVRDAAAAVALATISLVPAFSVYGLVLGSLTARPTDALHIVLMLAQTLPLAFRRATPAAVLAVVGVAFGLDQCLGYPSSSAGLGLLIALYSAGAHVRRRRVTVAATAVAYAVLAVLLTMLGSPERPWEFVTFAAVLAAAWVVGEVVRLRAAAARARAHDTARAAVFAERAHLARELHDVVGHHVTGMVVQADAAAASTAAGAPVSAAQLSTIAESGRQALADLRQLLDVLGPTEPSRAPAIGSIDDLVAAARAAGQRIQLQVDGAADAGDELRLAVYRIVQEGLTNARKHAPGARTDVQVTWNPGEVHARLVTGAGRTAGRGGFPHGGRGLAGLRERVQRLRGELSTGMDAAGRFVLEAHIPLHDVASREDEHDAPRV